MEQNQEYIVAEYKRLKDHLGRQPTSKEFYKETNISLGNLVRIFGSKPYSKLVEECGDIPNIFTKAKSILEQTLIQWGNLAKEKKELPKVSDWTFHKLKPTASKLEAAHGFKWGEIPYKFLEFFYDKEEWKEVISMIPNRAVIEQTYPKSISKIDGLSFDILKFLPPIVQNFIDLSTDEERAREFEINVNLIFQMLGFEVTEYGQGTGRKPDGVAKENQFRYAILIDAKARMESYKLGTEDRKFIEYIKTFSEPLRKSGFSKIYFLIVSSRFDNVSEVAIRNIKLETEVTTSLLTSRLLLKLLASKIKSPSLFDLKKFQELLIDNGEITEKKVERFIG